MNKEVIINVVSLIIEYDESLKYLLLENGFNCDNILDICRSGLIRHTIDRNKILVAINDFLLTHKSGCIFMLPSKINIHNCHVYYSPMSSNEIRRVVALKIFL